MEERCRQIDFGSLLEKFHAENGNAVQITGQKDSVSATNTTSKKPGDIMEEFSNGSKRIYEITVKPFSEEDDRIA